MIIFLPRSAPPGRKYLAMTLLGSGSKCTGLRFTVIAMLTFYSSPPCLILIGETGIRGKVFNRENSDPARFAKEFRLRISSAHEGSMQAPPEFGWIRGQGCVQGGVGCGGAPCQSGACLRHPTGGYSCAWLGFWNRRSPPTRVRQGAKPSRHDGGAPCVALLFICRLVMMMREPVPGASIVGEWQLACADCGLGKKVIHAHVQASLPVALHGMAVMAMMGT